MINLKPLFEEVSGNTFISLDTATVPKLKGGKANPHQGRIRKLMNGANVMVFTNQNSNGYENMVHRRLMQEGKDPETFELGERPWGTRVPNLPIVEHNESQYLEVIFLRPGQVSYLLDGKPIEKADIQGLEDKEVNEESQGGLDKKVVIRTFKADSIVRLVINGQEFRANAANS